MARNPAPLPGPRRAAEEAHRQCRLCGHPCTTREDRLWGLGEDCWHGDIVGRSLAAPPPLAIHESSGARRRPTSVSVLVDHGWIPDGTRLMYRPNAVEERAIGEWLSQDPSSYLATWTNHPRHPLVWAVDHQAYSPSALLRRIWDEAQWDEALSAVQGARSWVVPGEGKLADLASALQPSTGNGGAA